MGIDGLKVEFASDEEQNGPDGREPDEASSASFGGLLLGVVETFVNGSRFSTFTDAIAFAILIGILLFRPAGLLGKMQVEKV